VARRVPLIARDLILDHKQLCLTLQEAAECLRADGQTVIRWGKSGRFKLAKFGNMSKKARTHAPLNILGCFALLNAVRAGRPQKPTPLRRG
jgi:hypothetical protein